VTTLDEAVAAARRRAPAAAAVVFAPMFPLPQEERQRLRVLASG
jgi:hypothetical protein